MLVSEHKKVKLLNVKGLPFLMIFLLACVLFHPAKTFGENKDMPLINALEIEGNRKIETETIEAKIKSRVGTALSQRIVQQDIRSLYGLGYFDDIRVEVEAFEGGVKLVFIIDEKPKIISIDFQGNKELKTEDLREKITISPGAIANYFLIKDNVDGIISHYHSEAFLHVSVIPVIREVSEDAVAVTFQIDEGLEVKIKKITINGNSRVSDKEIKKAIKTREKWFFSFITGSGVYKRDVMEADLERIKDLYHSKGFINVKISKPEITPGPERKKLYITLNISEGDQFSVGEVSFSGNFVYGSTELYKHIKTAPGEIFNRTAVRKDIDSLIEIHTEKGYATADIKPRTEVDTRNKLINVDFSVTEGEVFNIGRIIVKGNEKTRDKVIRREMRLDEGDIYNSKLIKRSYQRITNLNFFESVELNPKPIINEKLIDIDVKVKEKLTGMLSVGGGYSSVDKFIATGEITQANLFGRGLYLKLKMDLSAVRANYNLKLTDPWFMDWPVSASISLYNEEFEFPDYDKEATGGTIGLGKELSEYVRGNITYKLENVEIFDVDEEASSIIIDQEGERLTSSISPSIWRDSRDNHLDPTSGSKNGLYTTFAGLGGDNYFIKTLYDSLWFFPFKWGTTFSLRGRIGYAEGIAGKDLPLYERFYVGGIDTVRGLGFGEGGPRDDKGEKIGGKKELIFNFEWIFPIEKNLRLKGVIFFDAGKSADNYSDVVDLRTTTGFGMRWMSPFGPIRLEWGYNLNKKDDESSSKIEFALGGLF
jgi:outer membrane protein insertion porin family